VAWRRALLLLLLPALLLAQMLGQAHAVAHPAPVHAGGAGLHRGADVAPQGVDGAHAHAGHDHGDDAGGLLASLFGHEAAECRLYDQLAHGDVLPAVPAAVAPLGAPSRLVAALHGLALARWAALFDARGPPALR
jgi:hypothetical protein